MLTDAAHGGLTNHYVVATGDVKNVTTNSATILISANYNYRESLKITPYVIFGDNPERDWRDNVILTENSEYATVVKTNNFTSSACEITLTNLKPATTYYYRAYATAQQPDQSYSHDCYGEIKSFTTPVDYSIIEAVDLGLSVKWANINIGATSEEAEGGKFYWGGTEPRKENYEPSWYGYNDSMLRKNRITDNDDNLYSSYDAATQIWGNKWRMPTKDEFWELMEKCTAKKTTLNGENVFIITGPSGKYIYLPVTNYWTSTADSRPGVNSPYSYYVYLTSSSWGLSYSGTRSYINSIRPVLK